MGGYLVNFAIYVMAMLGLIFFALLIYQKASKTGSFGRKNGQFLGIEDTLSIGARKNLYVVRAGNERFLIAGDIDKTTLIAKLNENRVACSQVPLAQKTEQDFERSTVQKTKRPHSSQSVDELPVIVDFQQRKSGSDKKIIQNMLKKINE